MTRTFTRYAVSAVLVAAAAIALWGIRNAIYAQQEGAATALPATGDADKARQLGLAMLNYAEAHGRFPPATRYRDDGMPLLSWRVLILPYLGENEQKLYSQFRLDEPWDSPTNKPLSEKIPSVFSPHDADADPFSSPDTYWQVFCGGTTIFANAQGMPFSDIHDGLSNTILLVESNTAVPWTKPVDLSFDALSPTTHQGLDVQRGFRVVMADGTVRKVPPSFPVDKLKELLTRKGNEHALDSSVLTQFDVWVPERRENNPNVRQQPSREGLIQSFRKGGAAGLSLEQQVRREFDARQASLREQIKDFSERLQRLTVLVDERDRAKEAIIQRRIDELRNPNLRWEAADQAGSGSNRSQQPVATDETADGAKPRVTVETFSLRHTKPDRVAKELIENFHGSAGIQLSQTSDSIKVAGAPADLERIRALIKDLDVPSSADSKPGSAASELYGLWESVLPPDIADTVPVEKRLSLVFHQNTHATFIGKTLQTACTFSVTPSASPKRIALHGDQPKRGLYEVSGDGLRLSIAPADAAFPTRFGTEKAEFKRINSAVPQEMLDAITSHLQDTTWSKRAGNRLSESDGNPFGGENKIKPQRDAEKAIEKALLEKVDANFEEVPLNEVFDSIASKIKVNVYIDEVALRGEGVKSDHPITINLKQPIALRSLLNQILSPLRLSYVVENDVLKITSEAEKGSVQPNAPVKLPDPIAVDDLLRRSLNDFHADLAWARANASRTQRAMDRQLVELKKTKPDATEADVENADKATWEAWHVAKHRRDLLVDQLASEQAVLEAAWKASGTKLEEERALLHRIVHGLAEGDVLDQRQVVEKLRQRQQQISYLHSLYRGLSDTGSNINVPNVALPGATEIEDDLRKLGIDGRSTTFKSDDIVGERKGLLIGAVVPESPAAKAGLQANDIIVSAHIWETASLGNLWYALSQVYTRRSDDTVDNIKLRVWRDGQYVTVHLPPKPLR